MQKKTVRRMLWVRSPKMLCIAVQRERPPPPGHMRRLADPVHRQSKRTAEGGAAAALLARAEGAGQPVQPVVEAGAGGRRRRLDVDGPAETSERELLRELRR